LTFAVLLAFGATAILLAIPSVRILSAGPSSVIGKAMADGTSSETLVILALIAVFKTSLSEEILFRGVIGKPLIEKFGFAIGNTIQAIAFAAVHLLLLLDPNADRLAAYVLIAFAGTMGWINGWLNERLGRGSIVPGWVVHAVANLLAYWALALRLFG